jgi:hypothetical protein
VAPEPPVDRTDPDFAAELGMRDRHEGRHLFVPHLDKFDLVGPLQGSDHAIDAVSGIPVNPPDAPRVQAFNN